MHKPVRRLVPRFLAFLTAPAVMLFDDLLVTAFILTGWIRKIVRLDMHDRSACGEEFRLITHSNFRLAQVVQQLNLATVEIHRALGSCARLWLEVLIVATGVIPSAKSMRLWDVRINLHGARADH